MVSIPMRWGISYNIQETPMFMIEPTRQKGVIYVKFYVECTMCHTDLQIFSNEITYRLCIVECCLPICMNVYDDDDNAPSDNVEF